MFAQYLRAFLIYLLQQCSYELNNTHRARGPAESTGNFRPFSPANNNNTDYFS